MCTLKDCVVIVTPWEGWNFFSGERSVQECRLCKAFTPWIGTTFCDFWAKKKKKEENTNKMCQFSLRKFLASDKISGLKM